MKLSWKDAQTFLAVSEHQSFSAAARALGLGQPAVSRRIQNLETRLNTQLFIRGKQGATPTSTASKLIPAAEQMARWAGEFDRAVEGTDLGIEGRVRIAAPPGVAAEQLVPFAALLQNMEPKVKLDILAGISHLDLTRGEADIAIRSRPPTEPELVAVHHAQAYTSVFASKSYAASIKQPCTWTDLDWITWAKPYLDVAPRPMLEKLIPDFNPVFTSDDYLVQKAAAREGLGALIMGYPSKLNSKDNALVEINMGITLPANDFYIVCAKSAQHIPRVARIIEHLIRSLNTLKETGELIP